MVDYGVKLDHEVTLIMVALVHKSENSVLYSFMDFELFTTLIEELKMNKTRMRIIIVA